MTTTQQPIRIALMGAGVFARDAHLPSLLRHPDRFEIAAIYSRTQASAETLAAQIPYPVPIFTSIDALLEQPEIEAVDILLPIVALPDAITHALQSGKHLISEKPIAADVATGRQLVAHYAHHAKDANRIWMVGENWR